MGRTGKRIGVRVNRQTDKQTDVSIVQNLKTKPKIVLKLLKQSFFSDGIARARRKENGFIA